MKLTVMSIMISLISVLEISRTLLKVKNDRVGIRTAGVWTFMWFAICLASLFPGILDRFMHMAQMYDRMFFVLVLAVFILFALVFELSTKLDKMQRDMGRIVQEISLERFNHDKKDGRLT